MRVLASLPDEVTDISVFSQLITFVEFVDPNSGKPLANLLSVDNVLEGFDSTNAHAISEIFLKSLVDSDVPFQKLLDFPPMEHQLCLGRTMVLQQDFVITIQN